MAKESLIPEEFELLNHTIKVEHHNAIPKGVGEDIYCHGCAEYGANEIRLYGDAGSVLDHTFYHELTHFLLHYSGRDDLSEDESFVDVFGGLLAQYMNTKR